MSSATSIKRFCTPLILGVVFGAALSSQLVDRLKSSFEPSPKRLTRAQVAEASALASQFCSQFDIPPLQAPSRTGELKAVEAAYIVNDQEVLGTDAIYGGRDNFDVIM